MAFLGDVILTTPVIKGIKDLYPDCKLWFLTTPLATGLINNDSQLAGVIAYQKRGKHRGLFGTMRFAKELSSYKFDLIISVHKSYRTSLLLKLISAPEKIGFVQAKFSSIYTKKVDMVGEHAVERVFSILKFHPRYSELKPEMHLAISEDRNKVRAQYNLTQKYIVIAPGSAWETKRWPAQHYRRVAEEFIQRGYQVVALGSKEEMPLTALALPTAGINLAGKLSLPESLLVLKSATALICNDSMILHAASALKVPTVAIFCATSPTFGFGPWENNAVVVEREDLECKPCSRHGARKCPLKTDACMIGLPPTKIISAFDSLNI